MLLFICNFLKKKKKSVIYIYKYLVFLTWENALKHL